MIIHALTTHTWRAKKTSQEWKTDPEVIVKLDDCTPEHGNPNTIRLFSTMANMNPIVITHLKSQWDITYQMAKRVPLQEPFRRVPQRFSSHRWSRWRNRYVSLHGAWCGSKFGACWALLKLIPAAKNMIHTTNLNRTVMTTIDDRLQICLGMVPGTAMYTTRGLWKYATERLRST